MLLQATFFDDLTQNRDWFLRNPAIDQQTLAASKCDLYN